MQILQGGNFGALIETRANPAGGGVGRRKRCDTRNVISNGGPSNRFFVVEGFSAQRRVDDQVDVAGFDEIDDIRPALVHLEDGFCWNACGFECGGGASCGKQQETEIMQLFPERAEVLLVAVVDTQKNRALARKALPGSELCFRERQSVRGG